MSFEVKRENRRSFLKYKFFKDKKVQRIILGLVFFVSITSLVISNVLPKKYDLKVGDVLQEDIVAEKEAIDTIATKKLQEAAAEAVPKKYTLDQTVVKEVKNQITEIFETIREVRSKDYLDVKEKAKVLKDSLSISLSNESYLTCVNMDSVQLKELETVTKAVIETVMDNGIKDDSIDRAKAFVLDEFKKINLPQNIKSVGIDIAITVIKPNMVLDREATEKGIKMAMEAVEPVKISKGQVLIEKGKPVTAEQIELLKELGLLAQDNKVNITIILGICLFILLLEFLLGYYIFYYFRNYFENNIDLMLITIVIFSTLFISVIFKHISPFLVPLAAGGMLITILLNPQIAIVALFIMSVLTGIIMGNEFTYSIMGLFGGIIGILFTSRISQRPDLTKAGGIVGFVNSLVILSLGLLDHLPWIEITKDIFWGMLNGILSSILTVGTLPFFENAFGVTTSVRLLELSNPNQPLLRRLLVEAPGTYHHSIIVGNLSEAAAESVGGDSLLARVGATYHDIGKLKRPYFFIENQFAQENPHDKLNPTLSALIIVSHIKDGLEIARQYKLPPVIMDFIAQHHGTSLMSYFYNKALNQEKNAEEASFRYDGPRPQTKEIAIVMLADSVEAAVRSMNKPTPGKIEGLIRQIIKEKLADGQLDESNLTLKDLDKIANAFSKVLTGIFHNRIEYPEKVKELERKGKNVYSSNKQSAG
ncbi:MAG: HD family phosphohydrolase [Thermovenabulum sp.]|uniref:HD family phosphohydrolase n=1 Tax=Thermovenabulum sp. TaxID=3100335 RepID=UPI003C7C928C